MQEIATLLAYPMIQLSYWLDGMAGGLGIFIGCVVILIVSGFVVTGSYKTPLKWILATLAFGLCYGAWFAWMSAPVGNVGVGNFILELAALFTLALVFSIGYRLSLLLLRRQGAPKYALAPLLLLLSVIVLRLFMPFIGK